jgi:hypothetical protein
MRSSSSLYFATGSPRSFIMPLPFSSSSAVSARRADVFGSGKAARVTWCQARPRF